MPADVGDSPDMSIPLPNVTANVLKKVLEYCEHHRADPLPVPTDENADENRRRVTEIGDWDAKVRAPPRGRASGAPGLT